MNTIHKVIYGKALPESEEYTKLFRYYGYKVYEWYDTDFPQELKDITDKFPLIIQRVDFARLWFVYYYGGIYVDQDVLPLKRFHENADFAAWEYNRAYIGAAIFAGSAGAQWLQDMMNQFIETANYKNPTHQQIVDCSPGLFTKMLQGGKYAQVKIFEPKYYYVVHPLNRESHITPEARAVHWHSASWKPLQKA